MNIATIDNLGWSGAKSVKVRWQRRMKITRCVVMTCHMSPYHTKTCEFVAGVKKFDDRYLYNFADLLAVDEAGQVLSEVVVPSFALAKKELVIGDTD